MNEALGDFSYGAYDSYDSYGSYTAYGPAGLIIWAEIRSLKLKPIAHNIF